MSKKLKNILYTFLIAFLMVLTFNHVTIQSETVTNGGVTINIPSYDPSTGWDNRGAFKDVEVIVNFGDKTTENKKIEVELPEGLRFEAISITPSTSTAGLNTSILDFYSGADPETAAILSMEVPRPQIGTNGNNGTFGKIKYEISSGTELITFRYKVSVDMSKYYGPHDIPEPIKATATMGVGNDVVGDTNIAIRAVGTPIGTGALTYYGLTSDGGTREVLESTPGNISSGISPQNMTGLTEWAARIEYRFAKRVEYTMHYPVGMEFSGTGLSNTNIISNDPATGRVVFESTGDWEPRRNWTTRYTVPIGLPPGDYTVSGPDSVTYTWYDGTTTTVTNANAYLHTTKVISLADVENKMNVIHHANRWQDAFDGTVTMGPNFVVANTTAGEKHNQVAEFEIEPQYRVVRVHLPVDPNSSNTVTTNIQYKTNLNDTWTSYSPSSGDLRRTGLVKILTKAEVGLAANEYFTAVKANMGSFTEGYVSGSIGAGPSLNWIHAIGRLDTAAANARVIFSMYDEDDRTDTLTSRSGLITNEQVNKRVGSDASGTFRNLNGTAINSVRAGDTFNINATLSLRHVEAMRKQALINPEIYIRQPEHFTIAIDSLELFNQNNQPVLWSYTEHQNAAGETIYIISPVNQAIGSMFHGANEELLTRTLRVNFNIGTSVRASTSYNIRDLIAFGSSTDSHIAVNSGTVDAYVDAHDFTGTGNTTGTVLSFRTNPLQMVENRNVLVETFLALQGEDPKGAYVEGNTNTIAFFTPGTDADYTVKITNNSPSPASTYIAYIPIPKTGQNFGTSFQDEAFKWDLALNSLLGSTPGFSVTYSSNATAANFDKAVVDGGAIYLNNPGSLQSVNMIKIEATAPLAIGAEVEFHVPLKVNETFETANQGNKIGTKNVYNPVYDVISATFSGRLPGTKVGTELVIAEIGGIVFIDKNGDGLYRAVDGDVLVKDHEVELYKWNETLNKYEAVLDSSSQPIKTTTDANGVYHFDYESNLGYGTYAVRFVERTDSTYQYTVHNLVDRTINSDAIIANDLPNPGDTFRGWAINIDATAPAAKTINCGFLQYNPPVDMGLTLDNSSESTISILGPLDTTGTANSKTVKLRIEPEFFGNIADKTINGNGINGETNNASVATIALSGTLVDKGTYLETEAVITGVSVGSTKVKVTIKDIYGQERDVEITVNVTANSRPVINATNKTVEAGTTPFSLLTGVTITDAEDGASFSGTVTVKDNDGFDIRKIGTYTIVFESASLDSHGNKALDKTITVTVEDTTKPVASITLVDNKTMNPTGATVSATDNADGVITYAWEVLSGATVVDSGTGATITIPTADGVYTLRATATDASGNVSDAVTRTITVDKTAPVITTSSTTQDIKIGTSGPIDYKTLYGVGASDALDSSINASSVSVNSSAVDLNKIGSYTVTFSATDHAGNVGTRSVTLVVVPLEVSGVVFEDLNYDSIKNSGDGVLSGVTINLVNASTNAIITSTVTNASGEYTFNLPTGSETVTNYAVMVVVPTGYTLADANKSGVAANDSSINLTSKKSANMTLSGADYENVNIGMAKDVSVSLSPLTHTVYVGDTVTSNLTITNGSLKSENVSDNTKIAIDTSATAVDIEGLASGQATVTLVFENNYQRASEDIEREIEVTVIPLPTMASSDNQLAIKETIDHDYTHTPANGTVEHLSGHDHIATIDANGKITGEARGSAHVTSEVTTSDNKKKANNRAVISVGLEYAPVVANDEAIDAIDFEMSIAEVVTVTDEMLIKKAKAEAWSTSEVTFNEDVTIVNIDKSKLKAKANVDSSGVSTKAREGYPVTFATADNTAVTVYVKVIDTGEKIEDIPTPETGNTIMNIAVMLFALSISTAYLYRRS